MGGLHSRNKGKGGEREVQALFKEALSPFMEDTSVIRRNHQQAEIGGADLVGIPYLSVEVKRVKQIPWGKGVEDWWQQCCEQAVVDEKWPVLVFRQDHGKWLVMCYVNIAWDTSEPVGKNMRAGIFQWQEFKRYLVQSWGTP